MAGVAYSFIICSIDDAKFAAICRNISDRFRAFSHEIIRIPDARSMTEGYNRGIVKSKGDRLVFCHDDIELLNSSFAARLDRHLGEYDLVGVAGTDCLAMGFWAGAGVHHIFGHIAQPDPQCGYTVTHFGTSKRVVGNIQALDGVFVAARRAVTERIAFDSNTFDGFHLYDVDFTYAAYLAGFKLAVAVDLHFLHTSGGDWGESYRTYIARFNAKYARKLSTAKLRTFGSAATHCTSIDDAIAVMEEAVGVGERL